MNADVIKELFALLNCLCGGLIFLGLLLYLFLSRDRRRAIAVIAILVVFACFLNSLILYFLV